jgi:putative photosynthetic complex assembly protein 2
MSMIAHAALFTVFVWWFTTGAIIYLDGLPRRTFAVSMTIATLVLTVALYGLSVTRGDTTVTGAYVAFTCALLAWGWNEMGFLMGVITGPRDTACPSHATGWQRLNYAIQAVLYHEAAIALTAFVIMVVTAEGANQVGLWTFATLWVMRLSAKINVYLGVPNITEEFLPPHLKYLKTYFRTRPMNAMFPVSITLATLLTAALFEQARLPSATPFETTAYALLATLSALALIEHWFMVLPIPATALWQWGLVSHAAHGVPVPMPVRLQPMVIAAEPAMVAAFNEATGLATSPPGRGPDGRPPPSQPQAGPTTIVPFPLPTLTSHRRRP